LKAAYKFYCGKDIINAHSAEADIKATYEVLLSQIEKYAGKDYEDRKGNISQPVKNDVEALHDFTNLNKPVDFAGRMVYDEDNQPLFNFGKHKGKTVFKVFDEEPSYYAWMMNGDFPLYTKNRLEKFWKQHREQKSENKQSARAPEIKTKPISTTNTKVDSPQQKQTPQQTQPKPKDNKPVDEDMLKMLAGKFKKL
nr:DNA polymerase III subunit epsilon [Pseudopedobacter sp.]